jgi:hypothetical protein
MIRKIFLVVALTSIVSMVTLQAQTPKKKSRHPKSNATSQVAPASQLVPGWTLTNGVWVHSDGYKFVNGTVIRTGTQTHKPPPKPPTQAQLDGAKKKSAPSPADAAAAKAAERERNLAPRPAPQTGTHL